MSLSNCSSISSVSVAGGKKTSSEIKCFGRFMLNKADTLAHKCKCMHSKAPCIIMKAVTSCCCSIIKALNATCHYCLSFSFLLPLWTLTSCKPDTLTHHISAAYHDWKKDYFSHPYLAGLLASGVITSGLYYIQSSCVQAGPVAVKKTKTKTMFEHWGLSWGERGRIGHWLERILHNWPVMIAGFFTYPWARKILSTGGMKEPILA